MKATQTDVLLKYLKEHDEGITSKVAFEEFGITRLSGLIFNLKKKGYPITSEEEAVQTRYGGTSIVARYRLVGDII